MTRDGVGQTGAQHHKFVLALILRSTAGPAHGVVEAPQLALSARVHIAHSAHYSVRLIVEIETIIDQLFEVDLGRAIEPGAVTATPFVATSTIPTAFSASIAAPVTPRWSATFATLATTAFAATTATALTRRIVRTAFARRTILLRLVGYLRLLRCLLICH